MTAKRLPSSDSSSSDQYGVVGSGGASSDSQKIASIERSITYLEATTSDTAKKVDSLLLEFAEAKGGFRTFKWVVGIVGGALTLLWAFVAAIVTMAIKHYLGW